MVHRWSRSPTLIRDRSMNWKASFLGSYFAHLLHRSLGWLLLVGSLFLLVQCGGGSGTVASSDDCKTEADDATDLTIVGTKLSSQRASIGDNLRVTVTIRNQGTATSGGAGSPQTVTFYRSSNKFISPRDEMLGTAPLDALEPNAESNPSFSFLARAGDSYYGACLGTTNNCQIGVKVSVSSPDISGSDSYTVCQLPKGGVFASVPSSSANSVLLDMNTNTVTEGVRINQGEITQYLMQIKQKGVLDIWSTGSQDTVALLFDGNCNAISEHYYAEDGGIGGSNNFQISAIAAEGYYLLVLYEKSLNAATFDITAILNYPPRVIGEDPLYSDQWHLNNPDDQEIDINAPQAWEITRGCPNVLVAVVDTRVDVTHPDLAPNHDDRYDNFDSPLDSHGTAVAGLVVAVGNNGLGVSGVAPEVSFVSRFAVGSGKTQNKAEALLRDKEQVAISNNSWGIGARVKGDFEPNDAIHQTVLEEGITSGYGGKGIFYVFAGGNYHEKGDNADYRFLTRYYGVAPICAVGRNGERASYSEKGANLWVCAPSRSPNQTGITTTIAGRGYDSYFGGTSASVPIVAGVAALMRSANLELGWRDIRLILAATAQKNDSTNLGWFEGMAIYDGSKSGSARYADTNTKYNHNHEYGFGLVNAEAAVLKSQSWNNVGQMVRTPFYSQDIPTDKQQVPDGDPTGLSSVITVTGLNATLDFIEYIDIELNMDGEHYGNLQINLISPANKTSTLAEEHHCVESTVLTGNVRPTACVFDTSTKASFGSARHLGESPDGDWTLKVIDEVINYNNNVYSWGLKFYGHKKP